MIPLHFTHTKHIQIAPHKNTSPLFYTDETPKITSDKQNTSKCHPSINTSHLQDMSLQKTDHASNRYSNRRVLHTQTQALGSNRSHFWSLYAPQVDCICSRFPWSMSKTATPDSQIMILRNTGELPYIMMYGIHWKVLQFWEIPMDVGCHILAFSKFEKPLKWIQFVYTGNPSNG